MSSSYRNSLNEWLSGLDVHTTGRVLDIGGAQLPVKGRTKSWDVEDYDYYILDLENPHADSPRHDYPLDMNKPLSNMVFLKFVGKAQVIFCLEVFDYVWNPLQAFRNISHLLGIGGTAWVSFPSFYPLHQPIDDDALRYMPGGIEKLAKATGLTIKQMIPRRPETDLLEQWYRAERMRAAKHVDHHFSGWIVEFTK